MSARGLGKFAALLVLCAAAGASRAGPFIFADDVNGIDVITHPAGYLGSGTALTVSVCISTSNLPVGASATMFENTVQKVIATWNARLVATQNLGLAADNDLSASQLDLESAILHETGHCLGLAHPNHASESGLADPQANGTKSTDGVNNVFNQSAGSDGLHGSRDDQRGDDVNLYWYRINSNGPLDFPATIDSTTFTRSGSLPAGHSFAANADRSVLAALGIASTESVMQQGQSIDEAQRRLTGEDVASIRLAQSGVDMDQGTADDYTFQLSYAGQTTNCDISIAFNTTTSFAACATEGDFIGASDHVRITNADITLNRNQTWYFSPAPNTTTTITSDSPDPSGVGASYTVNVTVAKALANPPGSPTGSVLVSDGSGATCTATLSSGSGSCSLASSTAGTKTLTATYLGLRGFDASSDSESHLVSSGPVATTTTITSDVPATSVVGQAVAVTFSVATVPPGGSPTGTVTVSAAGGSETCSATLPTSTCNITLTAPGSRTLTATYAPGAGFTGSSDTEPHTVNQAGTTTTITSDVPATSVVGQPVAVTFSVVATAPGAGTPTGTVTITALSGSETCSANLPTASCNITLTAPGPRTLTATYAGDTNFNGSTDTEAHSVVQAASTTTITSDSPATSVVGQAVAVTFSVAATAPGAGTPTGTVTITALSGSETCSANLPAISCDITLTAPGPRTLTATYNGDANFTGSSDAEAHSVVQAAATTTITGEVPAASVVGQAVNVTFSVVATPPGAGTPTGTVTITAQGGSESCNATLPTDNCNITLNATGSRTLTAVYSGDANFTGSSDTDTHTVNKGNTLTSIVSSVPNPSAPNAPVTVTVSVAVVAPASGTPTGNVSISASGGAETCQFVLPATSCVVVLSIEGLRTLSADYLGDANFNQSSDSENQIVSDLIFADGFELP